MRKETVDLNEYEQMDGVEDVSAWIEQENPFVVMVQFRMQGLLKPDEMEKAFLMRRSEWVSYMREKAGLAPDDRSEGRVKTPSVADR